jgi:hypothetical protein
MLSIRRFVYCRRWFLENYFLGYGKTKTWKCLF